MTTGLKGLRGGEAQSLAERAHRILEERIVTLRLTPGAWVTEQELAQIVGLGRTPVREALQRLIGDGLVIVYPRRGLKISEIDPIDVFQALDTRVILERLQARTAAAQAKPVERKRCAEHARRMRGLGADADPAGYMQLDHACDQLIAAAAGNAFTSRALAPLQTISRRAWYRFCRDADLAAAASLHGDLLSAIRDGRADAADAAAAALIAHVREAIAAGVAQAEASA